MRILIFANPELSEAILIGKRICDFLEKLQIHVVAREELALQLGIATYCANEPPDLVLSLGGDGTLLRCVHHYPELRSPLAGVNLGHLGFMADIPVAELEHSLLAIIRKEYRVQDHLVMEGRFSSGGTCFAINDIVIHRGKNPFLIDLEIHVDGRYLNTFSADGLILSTPCGSTAYSLAAGGPILSLEVEAFIITPICPHTLSNRPFVLMPKESLHIRYVSPYEPIEVSYDGILGPSLHYGDSLDIARDSRYIPMIKLRDYDPFHTLRTKLGWSGGVRRGLCHHPNKNQSDKEVILERS